MECNFEAEKCAIPGNFVCRRCKKCNHSITVPADVPEAALASAIESIKANCQHGKGFAMPASPPPPPPPGTDPTAGLPDPVTGLTPTEGPGAYLKKYLSRIGITSTPTCSCNAKARHMDDMGVEWCEANLDTIVGWLKEEAEKRNLPFFDWPARMLVQKAIRSAKKAKEAQIKTLGPAGM
jgi:hypothetical protein